MKHKVLKFTAAAVVLAGGLTLASNTFAAAHVAVSRSAAVVKRAKEKLGVTDEQVAKIKSEVITEKDNITELLHRLHAARTELRKTIQKADTTENEIRGAAAKVAAVEADAAVLHAKLQKKIALVLTTEQQSKLKEMRGKAGWFADRFIDKIGEKLGE
jgi:Spy/CpxP family protein refolding chaperone